jgi:2-iminobutanoate/2-iminopropanoate deaminase
MKYQKQPRIGGRGPSTYLVVVVFALAAAMLQAGRSDGDEWASAAGPPEESNQAGPSSLVVPSEYFELKNAEVLLRATHKEAILPRQIVSADRAHKPPPTYSQAVHAAGLVFVSGTGPYDPMLGTITGDSIQEQGHQCLINISAILEAAGSALDRVASATVILRNDDDFAGMNEEWLRWFPQNPPARQAARLPVHVEGLKVSIAVIAEG